MNAKLLGFAGAALTLLCSLTVGTARANSLTGDVISGSYDFPCDTCSDSGGFAYFTNPFVVGGPAAETELLIGNPVYYSAWDVYFNANSVTLTMAAAPLTDASYSGDPFNGPVFTVLSGNSFGSVTGVVANNPDCIPLSHYLSLALVRWVCLAGAGNGKSQLSQPSGKIVDRMRTRHVLGE